MLNRRAAVITCRSLIFVWIAATLTGCNAPSHQDSVKRPPIPDPPPQQAPTTPKPTTQKPIAPPRAANHRTRPIGTSIAGTPIECHQFGSGSPVLFIGGIHGNEPASARLIEMLAVHLRSHPDAAHDRGVITVPNANPDGLADGTRTNRHRIDLNRNFPAANRRDGGRYGAKALSEPESRALHALIIAEKPTAIVSVHQPAACVDFDGPAESLARRIAKACGLPIRRLGSKPGSLGSFAGESLGIPVITLELPGSASRLPHEELWRRFGPALLIAVDP